MTRQHTAVLHTFMSAWTWLILWLTALWSANDLCNLNWRRAPCSCEKVAGDNLELAAINFNFGLNYFDNSLLLEHKADNIFSELRATLITSFIYQKNHVGFSKEGHFCQGSENCPRSEKEWLFTCGDAVSDIWNCLSSTYNRKVLCLCVTFFLNFWEVQKLFWEVQKLFLQVQKLFWQVQKLFWQVQVPRKNKTK